MISTWLRTSWKSSSQFPQHVPRVSGNKSMSPNGSLLSVMGSSLNQTCQRTLSSTSLPATQRVYILGVGNLGRLFAHALATQPNPPPITLLCHREALLAEWEQAGRAIELTAKGVVSRSTGYDVELIDSKNEEKGSIYNLIITTKATQTVQALSPIAGRIHPSSTLLFAQNGMGVVSKVVDTLGPKHQALSMYTPEKELESNLLVPQPRFLAAIASHGLFSTGPFRSVHAGLGSITLGEASLPSKHTSKLTSSSTLSPPNPSYLLNHLLTSPLLSATIAPPSSLYHSQLEKLTANAIINPLTALTHLQNGYILTHPSLKLLIASLLSEISAVLRAQFPEDVLIQETFSTERLEILVMGVAEKTKENRSSMLQDVLAGKETEIDFINGWIVERGKEVGVDVETNERIVRLVKEGGRLEV